MKPPRTNKDLLNNKVIENVKKVFNELLTIKNNSKYTQKHECDTCRFSNWDSGKCIIDMEYMEDEETGNYGCGVFYLIKDI